MDGGFYLFLSFRAVNGLRTALGNVRGSVELSALATVPQPVQRDAFSFQCGGGQLLGYYGVAATHSGKAGGFGEAAELYGYLFWLLLSRKWSGGCRGLECRLRRLRHKESMCRSPVRNSPISSILLY